MDHLSYLFLVFVMLLRLFIAALWSPAGKGLVFWLSFVMFNCVFVTFPCSILGQMWYLIVSLPDLCQLSYFDNWYEVSPSRTLPSKFVQMVLWQKMVSKLGVTCFTSTFIVKTIVLFETTRPRAVIFCM